ncbi:hypothetical protein [Sandaracinus amylolyticus]|uniref:Putative lipoprotein n=1 Tax=Sandaracinus amylolyticus TaxID=927083 RepID=A0A0F6W7S7_9BACT|nr:hypothetical protein [Sandaracinus amylolyticus]AKF09465.1 putative lipoprotein [Sandaracinus amylolyticus]
MSSRAIAIALAALAIGGCYRDVTLSDPLWRDAAVSRPDAGAAIDAGLRDGGWREPSGMCTGSTPVDLLIVVDSSSSMAEEQDSLVAQLPRLIGELVDPPDRDGDSQPDWPAITDLHVGVITPDLGVGGYTIPSCDDEANFGDDGVLREVASADGCSATYPPILEFGAGDDPAAFANDVACVARVGTGGCGFEQPLEAALKALSPSTPQPYTAPDYVPPTFVAGTSGHADGANAGFLRDGSLLAVIVLTDEEDCSVRDVELFDTSSPRYVTDLNLRCFAYPEALHPVERYVGGLLALRADRPDLFALAVIAGIPADAAVPLPSLDDYERILARPEMEERVDPEMPTRLVPSCNGPTGIAFPPRRLVRAVAGVGRGRGTVQSICQEDFTPAVAPIVSLIGRRACAEHAPL